MSYDLSDYRSSSSSQSQTSSDSKGPEIKGSHNVSSSARQQARKWAKVWLEWFEDDTIQDVDGGMSADQMHAQLKDPVAGPHDEREVRRLDLDLSWLSDYDCDDHSGPNEKEMLECVIDNPADELHYARLGLEAAIRSTIGEEDTPQPSKYSISLTNPVGSPESGVKEWITPADSLTDRDGELVVMRVDIRAMSQPLTKIEEAEYECQRCGTISPIPQEGDELTPPPKCIGCERQGPFDILTEKSVLSEYMELEIEEPVSSRDGGGSPASLHARTTSSAGLSDLEEHQPGDTIDVIGAVNIDFKQSVVADYSIDVLGIEAVGDEDIEMTMTDRDWELVKSVQESDQSILEVVANSIAPGIYGREIEKRAAALSLVGAPSQPNQHGQRVRGESHLLLVGDPGTGKSEIASAVAELSPRSAKVDGVGATDVGLTASTTEVSIAGDSGWILTPGALPLADGGHVVIDELDKLGNANVLHEPMEKGEMKVDKATIHRTLSAETTVVATANPKHSKFVDEEPFREQIDFPDSLLDRFDLVLIVREDADKSTRKRIGEQVAANMAGEGTEQFSEGIQLPYETLKRYIAHVRQHEPTVDLNGDAIEKATDWFAEIGRTEGVNVRIQQGVLRLAMASARLRLADKVELEDVSLAMELVGEMLSRLGKMSNGETGMSAFTQPEYDELNLKKKQDAVMAAIKEVDTDVGVSIDEIMDVLEKDLSRTSVEGVIDRLKKRGKIAGGKENLKLVEEYKG